MITLDKATLRQQLIAARLALSTAARQQYEAALHQHLRQLLHDLAYDSVAFCWPYRGEPDLVSCIAAWLATQAQHCAALPVVTTTDAPLSFRAWTPATALTTDRYGIPTPIDSDFIQPQALLIPMNGFDLRGYRLGYGGGYFDRTLARTNVQTTIGYSFEVGRVAQLPNEAHDQTLDWIVTEAGVFKTTKGR